MRKITQIGKQVSKGFEYPRLTLTKDLSEIGLKAGDEVLIEIKTDCIVITPIRKEGVPDD